jgi:hypothetical protein
VGIDVSPSPGPVIENNILVNAVVATDPTTHGSQAIHFGSNNDTGATTNAFVIRTKHAQTLLTQMSRTLEDANARLREIFAERERLRAGR